LIAPPANQFAGYPFPNLLKQVQTSPPTGFSRFDAPQAQNLFCAEIAKPTHLRFHPCESIRRLSVSKPAQAGSNITPNQLQPV